MVKIVGFRGQDVQEVTGEDNRGSTTDITKATRVCAAICAAADPGRHGDTP